jgi:hypothetical protein
MRLRWCEGADCTKNTLSICERTACRRFGGSRWRRLGCARAAERVAGPREGDHSGGARSVLCKETREQSVGSKGTALATWPVALKLWIAHTALAGTPELVVADADAAGSGAGPEV